MKKLLLSIILSITCIINGWGQIPDAQIEHMMSKRVLTAGDVGLNIASLAPDLYKNNKVDTLRQLLTYFERNYGMGRSVTPLRFLLDIKDRQFKEELQPPSQSNISDTSYYAENILPLLRTFNKLCSNLVQPGFYTEDVRQAYIPYVALIGRLAEELKAIPALSPAEKFLTGYFAHPANDSLAMLKNERYNGTRLQRAWLAEERNNAKILGKSFAVLAGVWLPMGNLSLVGPHPYVGYVFGGRGNKFSIEANLSFRFLNSANGYTVIANQQLYNTSHYFGGYLGLDGMYELWRKRKKAVELLGGCGWDGMDAFKSNSKDKTAPVKSLNSINLNMGIGYRIFLRQRYKQSIYWGRKRLDHEISYLAFQAKYNVINYANPGATPMDGHALTFGILYGLYSHTVKRL